MFGDKIILLHFYVSLSHFALCTQEKTCQLNVCCFLFLSQHAFFQNFSLSQQKEVCLKFVVTKVPQQMYCKFFFAKVFGQSFFCLTNYLNNGC